MIMRIGGVRVLVVSLAAVELVAVAFAGCSGQGAHDPCALLSAGEALPYVGALVAPPYRASDGAADVRGDECMYRGKDGRELTIRPEWLGARFVRQAAVGSAERLAGPWDRATWLSRGSLLASKGDARVAIDVSGSSGEKRDALALAQV
ncbi:MAG: hypothetical protein ACHQWU_10005, partial [Gemmatimonadales bacterium]